jgi:hypothetical protein
VTLFRVHKHFTAADTLPSRGFFKLGESRVGGAAA